MHVDRDYLYPAVSAADATWRQVGNWRTEAALLARGVSAAPILAGVASAAGALSASLTTRVELFRDVIQLGSIAINTIKKQLSPAFETFRHWTQFVRVARVPHPPRLAAHAPRAARRGPAHRSSSSTLASSTVPTSTR